MQNLLVVKKAGQLAPDAFWSKVAAAKPGYCSAAVFVAGSEEIMAYPRSGLEEKVNFEPSKIINVVKEAADRYKEMNTAYFFSDTIEHADNFQPFTLLVNSEDNPILVCFCTGEPDDEYKIKDSPQSPFFHMVNSYFIEEIRSMWEEVDESMEELMKKLRSDVCRKRFSKMIGKGSVTLLALEDEWVMYTKDMTLVEFPWGNVTDALGYSEGEFPAKEKEDIAGKVKGVAKSVLEGMAGMFSGKETATSAAALEAGQKAQDAASGADDNDPLNWVMIGPAPNWSKQQKSAWYIAATGAIPPAYKNGPKVKVHKKHIPSLETMGGKTNSFLEYGRKTHGVDKEGKKLTPEAAAASGYKPFAAPDSPAATGATKEKDVTPHHITTLPVLTKEQKEAGNTALEEIITAPDYNPMTTQAMQDLEERYSRAWDAVGTDLFTFLTLPHAARVAIAGKMKNGHEWMALAVTNLCCYILTRAEEHGEIEDLKGLDNEEKAALEAKRTERSEGEKAPEEKPVTPKPAAKRVQF